MVKKIEVVLTQDVKGLGTKNHITKVAPSYFTNVLKVKGLAILANKDIVAKIEKEHQKKLLAEKQILDNLNLLIEKINKNQSMNIKVTATENNTLYDKLDSKDIIQEISKQYNIEISKDHLILEHKIEKLGEYTFRLQYADINFEIKLIVKKK